MTRLGNSSPSCSGFEAEPLCWLQHSANRWQQDWHSQENSSCGGQRAAERERSSQTEGEEGEGEKGRGCGEETLHSSQAQPLLGQILSTPPQRAPTRAHAATSAHPNQGAQGPSRTLKAHRLPGLPPPKALTGHLPSPLTLLLIFSSQLTSPACDSWATWHRAHLSPFGGGRHLGLSSEL